jgi:hypothetical protein
MRRRSASSLGVSPTMLSASQPSICGCCGTNANTCISPPFSPCSDASASEEAISARLRGGIQETETKLRASNYPGGCFSYKSWVENPPAHLYILDDDHSKSHAGLSFLLNSVPRRSLTTSEILFISRGTF